MWLGWLVLLEHRAGERLDLSKLGNKCGPWAGSRVCVSVSVPRMGKRNGSCQFLCSQRYLSMITASLGHALRWAPNLPTVCPRGSSDPSFIHAACLRTICPSSSPRVTVIASALYPSQPHWPLELPTLSPAGCKNSWDLVFLTFQASCYGDSLPPCTPPCAILSLAGLCNHSPSSLLQWSGSISPPSCISALPPSSVWPFLSL